MHPGLSTITSFPAFKASIDRFALSLGIDEIKIMSISLSLKITSLLSTFLILGYFLLNCLSVNGEPSVQK